MKSLKTSLLLALLAGWIARSGQAGVDVLCMGDSITLGVYVSLPYPSRLARNTGASVINAGVGGVRTGRGLATIDALMAQCDPAYVLIMYGTNDINGPDVDLRNSASIVLQTALRARARGATPVIGTVPPQIGPRAGNMSRVREFNGYLRAHAAANGIGLADVQGAFGSGSGLFVSDGFHPNDSGAEVIARTFGAFIPPMFLRPSSRTSPCDGARGQTFAVDTDYHWTASANRSWIHITAGASGTGDGTVTYDVDENIGPSRSGTIQISGGGTSRGFTASQAASPSLRITSPYGAPVPAVGTTWMRANTLTNAWSGASPVVVGISNQYVCSGWQGTGNAPRSGSATNTGPFVVTTASTVTWLWNVNYWLATAARGNGTVNVDSGWYAKASRVPIRATPRAGSRFFRWSGALTGTSSNIVVEMKSAKAVTALFGVYLSVQARGLDGSTKRIKVHATPGDVFGNILQSAPCKFSHVNGTVVGLRAPKFLSGGWQLVGWTGVDSWNDTNAVVTASSHLQVTVLYDPPPQVTIKSPTTSSSWRTTNGVVRLAGVASSFAGVTKVEVSNARGSRNLLCAGTTNWSFAGLKLFPGVNPITVKGFNAYGHTAVDTVAVTYSSKAVALQGLSLLAGTVVRDIQMPDNLAPGTTNTIRWQVEAYEPALSALKIRLPDGAGVTNVTVNGRRTGEAPGSWTMSGWASKVYGFEADWVVPNQPGSCRVRFLTARQDGYAYVNASIPDGVESPPYGSDGKEIARTIVAGGSTPVLQNEPLATDAKPFEKIAEAQLRAGAVVRHITIPDNLAPGSVVTCRWSLLSYPAVKSRLRVALPTETDAFGMGVLKATSNSVWRLPGRGAIVEYDGTAANDAPGKVGSYYRMKQRNLQCVWTVPNDPGPCRISIEVMLNSGTNWVNGILREGVDGQITGDHTGILRDITAGGAAPVPLALGLAATTGTIRYYGDANWYVFTVGASGTYRVQTYLGTLQDTILKLYGPGNQTDLIQQNDNAVGRASRVIVPLDAGTYYVKITAPPTRKGSYDLLVVQEP